MSAREGLRETILRAQGGDRMAFEGLVGECRDVLARHVGLELGARLRGAVEVDDIV